MLYCPKCKTEYEDHAKMCVDCELELVSDLEACVYFKPLITVKKEDLEQLLDYLAYSGIKNVQNEVVDNDVSVSVGEREYQQALAYLEVYVKENMEEVNAEDYYFDEYEVEEVETEETIADMRSTVVTFGGVGLASLIFAVLNYLDIISINGFNKSVLSATLGIVGVVFIIIAIKTASGINETVESGKDTQHLVEGMVNWYRDERGFEDFYKRHTIDTEPLDEGALYFLVFDIIKKELKTQYPESKETVINTATESICDEL